MTELPKNQAPSEDDEIEVNIRDGHQYQPNALYGRPFIDHYMRDVWQYLNSCKDSFKTSKSTITKMTGHSKRKLDSIIRDLAKYNLIKVKRTRNGKINFTNKYELVEPKYWGGGARGALGWCTPCTRGGAPDALEVVHEVHPKNTTEKTIKNTNVEGGTVDKFEDPYTKEEFKDIFELINPLHGYVHPEKAGAIAKYYIKLLKKDETRTLELIQKYAKGVRLGSQFDKSIRWDKGSLFFDTNYKTAFEKELKDG